MQWSVRHDLGRRDVLEICRCTVLDVASEVTAFTSQTNLQKNIVSIRRVISIKMLIALKRLNDVVLCYCSSSQDSCWSFRED